MRSPRLTQGCRADYYYYYTTTTTTTTTALFNIDIKHRTYPSTRCPSVANTISSNSGTFNGGSDLIKDLLDVEIFTKQIRTLNTFYAVVR